MRKRARCWVCHARCDDPGPLPTCKPCKLEAEAGPAVEWVGAGNARYKNSLVHPEHEARVEHYRQMVEAGYRLFEPTPGLPPISLPARPWARYVDFLAWLLRGAA